MSQWGNTYPAKLSSGVSFLELSLADRQRLATTAVLSATPGYGAGDFGGNMGTLDDMSPYFDMGLRQLNSSAIGIWHYACTRNNNFSNRDQKAKIVVSTSSVTYGTLGYNGGTVATPDGNSLASPIGALSGIVALSIEDSPTSTSSSIQGAVASDFVTIVPTVFPLSGSSTMHLRVQYSINRFGTASLYRADTINGNWQSQDADCEGGVCGANIPVGGTYVVQTKTNWGAVVGITLAILIVLAVSTAIGYKKYREKYSPAARAKLAAMGNTTDVEKASPIVLTTPTASSTAAIISTRNNPTAA